MQRLTAEHGNRELLQSTEDIIGTTAGSGRWQIFVTLLMSFSILAHLTNSTAEGMLHFQGWWCEKPPELKHWSNSEWIVYSHLNVSRDNVTYDLLQREVFRSCSIYDVDYSTLKNLNFEESPPIETNRTIRCPFGVHYSKKSGQSPAQKFDNGCKSGFASSKTWLWVSCAGRTMGYVIFGILGDRIGRKRVILISCGVTPMTAIIVSLMTRYEMFLLMSAIHSIFHGGFAMCVVLIVEISTDAWRSGLTAIGSSFFAIGIGLMPVMINAFETFDRMIVFVNMPCLVVIACIGILPESPSWLFCTGNIGRLEDLIKKAAKINRSTVPAIFKVSYIEYADERQLTPQKPPRVWNLLFASEVVCEIIGLTYLTALFAMIVGSSFDKMLLSVIKSYTAYTLLGAATTVGIVISQLCILMMSHRKILQISIGLILVSSTMLMIELHEMIPTITGPKMTFLIATIGTVSLGYGVLLNYNVRTIPTLLRGTYFGIWRAIWALFGWAGGNDYINFPGITFVLVVTTFIAVLFSLNVRDIHGRELPDTLFDSINFKIKPKPKRWTITVPNLKQDFHVNQERPSNRIDRRGRRSGDSRTRSTVIDEGERT